LPARSSAHDSPLPTAPPGTPLFLARWPLPFVLIRRVCEGSLFVCDQTDVTLGLNRFDDPTDERPATLRGTLLKELLDVVSNDGHLRCPTAWPRARRFDRGFRQQLQDSSLSFRPHRHEVAVEIETAGHAHRRAAPGRHQHDADLTVAFIGRVQKNRAAIKLHR